MANTSSLGFPSMFNVSQNTVSVLEDNVSIVNRTRLLMLTEPTELYNNPSFGLGLKKHLWKYNTPNEKSIIQDSIIKQLRLYEPCVKPDEIQIADGLQFTGNEDATLQQYNELNLTVALITTYGDKVEVKINDIN